MIIIEIGVSLNVTLEKCTIMDAEMESEVLGNNESSIFHRLALGHGGGGRVLVVSAQLLPPQSKERNF